MRKICYRRTYAIKTELKARLSRKIRELTSAQSDLSGLVWGGGQSGVRVNILHYRSFSASSLYGEAGLMVSGGKADDEDIPEVFSAGSWTEVGVTPSHLYNHCQVSLAGRIYLVGGRGRHDRLESVRKRPAEIISNHSNYL